MEGHRERLIGPELLAAERAAWDLENERDAALLDARTAQGMLQGYIDQANENSIRVHELERERDAALAREAVLREALDGLLPAPGADPKRVNAALGILATPSPAAEALLELAVAAVAAEEIDGEMDGRTRLRIEHALSDAVEKWQRARREGMR